jgi:hemoglobin-like flavoprotein
MKKTDDAAPVTRGDLENLWKRIAKHVSCEVHDLRLHYDIVSENMLQDFNGAFGDRLSQNADEIQGVKARVGAIERRLRFSGR